MSVVDCHGTLRLANKGAFDALVILLRGVQIRVVRGVPSFTPGRRTNKQKNKRLCGSITSIVVAILIIAITIAVLHIAYTN